MNPKLEQARGLLDNTLNFLMNNPAGQHLIGGAAGLGVGYLAGQLYNQMANSTFDIDPMYLGIAGATAGAMKGRSLMNRYHQMRNPQPPAPQIPA